MILRPQLMHAVQTALDRNPVVALLGPRQCGKTTLAREFLPADSGSYFDLEDPAVAGFFESPKAALAGVKGLVVIDEAQRQPGLFPVLRVLADRNPSPARFLILGSASPDLSRQASESLAGRVEIIQMGGFGLQETGEMETLWTRGGFPRSFLAESSADSYAWRQNFVRTFLERDLAGLGFGLPPALMLRFWTMVAHYHGQTWNATETAASLGVAPNTARRYLDILDQTFMVRQLQPWFSNTGKRLVKKPKIYFRDSGLFHTLMGISCMKDLISNPKLGASWEGFALEESLRVFQPEQAYFWALHSGAELDLLLFKNGRRIGLEFKRTDTPRITPSIHSAVEHLGLDETLIVYPGSRVMELAPTIRAVPLDQLAQSANP